MNNINIYILFFILLFLILYFIYFFSINNKFYNEKFINYYKKKHSEKESENLDKVIFYPQKLCERTEEYILPKIIYIYWDNLVEEKDYHKLSEEDRIKNRIINSHLKTIRRNISKDWKIILMNKSNVVDYTGEEFVKKYGNLPAYRFSDFLRIHLLYNKGGCWIDAGIFIVNGKFIDNYYEQTLYYKFDACLYEYSKRSMYYNQPHLDNWFMMAPKNSIIIGDLYYEFNKAFEMGFLNYKKKVLIPSGVDLSNTIGYKRRTYLMQHAIIKYLFYTNKQKYKINIKEAEDSMFKIQSVHNWKKDDVIRFIITNNKWNDYYAIKLTRHDRKGINKDNIENYEKRMESFKDLEEYATINSWNYNNIY